jgi:lipopolysaccharide transport system ATP-binding protein
VTLSDLDNRPTTSVILGGGIAVNLELADFMGESDMTLMINIGDVFGTSLAQAHSKCQSNIDLKGLRQVRARCVIEDFRLVPGDYTLTVSVGDSGTRLDCIDNAMTFTVLPADIYNTGKVPRRKEGLVALAARWEVTGAGARGYA